MKLLSFRFPEIATKWGVCCGAVISFALLQLIVGWQRGRGQNPICNGSVEYSPWVGNFNAFASSASLATALNQIVRVNVSTFTFRGGDFDTFFLIVASFCLNIITGSATFLTYLLDWGGTCVNVYR